MTLTDAQKAELIRRGNTLFNEGRYFEAGKVFATVGYKTGLIRLGDLFYYEKHKPLVAYGFYRKANHKPMLDKIGDSFVFALKCLLDEGPEESKAKRSVSESQEEELKVRQANAPTDSMPRRQETIERKIERAVAMLKRLGSAPPHN